MSTIVLIGFVNRNGDSFLHVYRALLDEFCLRDGCGFDVAWTNPCNCTLLPEVTVDIFVMLMSCYLSVVCSSWHVTFFLTGYEQVKFNRASLNLYRGELITLAPPLITHAHLWSPLLTSDLPCSPRRGELRVSSG